MSLNPKCINHRNGNNELVTKAVNNRGQLMPCCYCDSGTLASKKDKILLELAKHSYINDWDSIEEMVNSEPWVNFYKELLDPDGEHSPICVYLCGTDKATGVRSEEFYDGGQRIKVIQL